MSIEVIIGVIVAVGALIAFLTVGLQMLKKYGVDDAKIKEIIDVVKKVEGVVDTGLNVADQVAPNNKIVDTLQLVESLAKKFTTNAEQLYLSAQLPKDQRNATVKAEVEKMLNFAGVQVTDEIRSYIDATIEEACFVLPHQSEPDKAIVTNLTNANNELQTQLSAQQNQVQQLQAQLQAQNDLVARAEALEAENGTLKNKLQSIISAVQ